MIITYNDVVQLRSDNADKKIAYSGGVFDLLHEGHLDLLQRLRGLGDIVVIGVTPDERVRARKGPTRPIHTQETRLTVLNAIKYVDYVFIAPTKAPGFRVMGHRTLQDLKPNYFMSTDTIWLKDEEWLKEQGTNLIIIPRLNEKISTTQTIEKVVSRHR